VTGCTQFSLLTSGHSVYTGVSTFHTSVEVCRNRKRIRTTS